MKVDKKKNQRVQFSKILSNSSFVYIYIYDEEFLILPRIEGIYFKKSVSQKNVRVSAARRPQI